MMRLLYPVTIVIFSVGSLFAQDPSVSKKYPNEIPGFRFYERARWKSVTPLVSTMRDVRRILGKPDEESDVAAFTKPYPGDEKAKRPVFVYELNPEWQLLVYFVRYCFEGGAPLPSSMDNTVCSLHLIPKKPQHFQKTLFPSLFKANPVDAIHGKWVEYADGQGLIYKVYTQIGPYDRQNDAGDLNRIVYTASDEEFNRRLTEPKQ